MLWAEESEEYILGWWERHGNNEVIEAVYALARAVEADELDRRYLVTPLASETSSFSVPLPVAGYCAVIEIFDDRVLLESIVHVDTSEDGFDLPW